MKTDFCANIYLLARVYYNNRLYMCDRERERGLNYQRSVCEQRVSIKEREREGERGNVHLISQVLVSKEAGVFV